MVSEKEIDTLAVVTTSIAVVGGLVAGIQNPNGPVRSAAVDHKVASVLMKRLNKHLVNKDVA